MTTTKNKNFSRHKLADLTGVQSGDTFEACNFAQTTPHTAILAGITGLSFTGCNLMNCGVPVDAVVEDCLTIHKSMCTNRHPAFTELALCPDNCSHVVDSDSVTIDGQVVGTIYHYKDTLEV